MTKHEYDYGIFKNNSLSQLLMQTEVDAVGICMSDGGVKVHAIDVAFHESGLNYGERRELVLASDEFESVRYYAKPLVIRGVQYRLCSQWYEVPANNDRPFLLAWLEKHQAISDSP